MTDHALARIANEARRFLHTCQRGDTQAEVEAAVQRLRDAIKDAEPRETEGCVG